MCCRSPWMSRQGSIGCGMGTDRVATLQGYNVKSLQGYIMAWRIFVAISLLALGLRPAELLSVEITVFAASSLTDSLKEIRTAYEQKTRDKIVFNFAASSVLARQIAEGAPTDIFFSAD